jgi:predicted dehydrogenase
VTERYKAVVIGCGRIGSGYSESARQPGVHSHAQAYHEHPRTELVAVVDADLARAAAAGLTWEVAAGSDPVQVCRKLSPDLVSICTPDESHAPLALALLREAPPRALLIEKPLATSASDAAAIVEAADRAGTLLAVNYTRRFSPAFQAIRNELAAGLHGRVELIRILYGKGLRHNGSHAIDLLRFWLGEPIRGSGQPVTWGPGDDETWSADLIFPGGTRARLDAFDERIATVFEADCLTEKSRWRFSLGGLQWEFATAGESPLYAGYRNYVPSGRERTDSRFERPLSECLTAAVDNLVEALEGRAPLLCGGTDGLAALEWIERLARAEAIA